LLAAEYERRCRTGCSIIIPNNQTVTLEVYNVWREGGCLLGFRQLEKKISSLMSIIGYAILGLIAGIVLWRESRILGFGFFTVNCVHDPVYFM
jgi:hypothetical protein